MINSRDINDLLPIVSEKCRLFIERARIIGIDILITSTYRDKQSQAALYAQGRTRSGPVITNAKPGQSLHNYRVAFDFAPIANGKIDWNNVALFKKCGEIAEECGLEWAGRWKGKFRELAHCQFTNGKDLAWFEKGGTLE